MDPIQIKCLDANWFEAEQVVDDDRKEARKSPKEETTRGDGEGGEGGGLSIPKLSREDVKKKLRDYYINQMVPTPGSSLVALCSAYAKEGCVEKVEHLLSQMYVRDIPLDFPTYTRVLSMYAKESNVSKVNQILQLVFERSFTVSEMERSKFPRFPQENLTLGLRSYCRIFHPIMQMYARGCHLDQAEGLLRMIVREEELRYELGNDVSGIDVITCNLLVTTYFRLGRLADAIEMMVNMDFPKGVRAWVENRDADGSDGRGEGRMEVASQVSFGREMSYRLKRIKPDTNTYSLLVSCLVHERSLTCAEKIFKYLLEVRDVVDNHGTLDLNNTTVVGPGQSTYWKMIQTYSHVGNHRKLENVVKEMRRENNRKWGKTLKPRNLRDHPIVFHLRELEYTNISKCYRKCGEVERLERLCRNLRNSWNNRRKVAVDVTGQKQILVIKRMLPPENQFLKKQIISESKNRKVNQPGEEEEEDGWKSEAKEVNDLLVEKQLPWATAERVRNSEEFMDSQEISVHETVRPLPAIYHDLMGCYDHLGKVEEVERIVREMEEDYRQGNDSLFPNMGTYNLLLSTYLKAGQFQKFEDLLKEIKEGKLIPGGGSSFTNGIRTSKPVDCVLKPDFFTYQVELELYVRLELPDKILEILERIDWSPEPRICSSIVMLFVHLGREDEILPRLRLDPRPSEGIYAK
eukprot:TRINITY_DN6388_c0_g3_i5.p1 TRINITY_DN6388_c0_g3~~TRINITY_DN6388_c0_g3_i5.p1  ORF type:complete len:789 (-),score=215.17 TRINITY_DN6388_c0_g3_i5:865-2934(-)